METQYFEDWLQNFDKAWEEKNPQAAADLFSYPVEYHETPFTPPYTTKEEIVQLWEEVPLSQKNITVKSNIILIQNDVCIAHWLAKFTRVKENKIAELDGVYYFKLNPQNLCYFFQMWWVAK